MDSFNRTIIGLKVYLTSKYDQEGFETWLNHEAQDMFSDFITTNVGSFTRNLLEDSILEFSRLKYRKNKYF